MSNSQSRKKAGAGPAVHGSQDLLIRRSSYQSYSQLLSCFPCTFPYYSLHSAWLVELEDCRLVPGTPELFSVRMWTT